jgi:hypothetical protein
MQYFHLALTSCIYYPICNICILKNYELENELGIASCTNYRMCNTCNMGHVKSIIFWSKLTLGGHWIPKCITYISIISKPIVGHDKCNICITNLLVSSNCLRFAQNLSLHRFVFFTHRWHASKTYVLHI